MKPDVILPFVVPQQHPCFPAHFPGQPIVPGALLMQWIFAQIRNQYCNYSIVTIKSMKFLKSLHPGDDCRLQLEGDPALLRLSIACYCHSDLVCKGVVELALIGHAPQEQLR